MKTCSYCQAYEGQVKAGLNKLGSQHTQCRKCRRLYTSTPKTHSYSTAIRQQTLQNYVNRMNLRWIGRLLGIDHHTVINWINAYTASLPNRPPPPPTVPNVCELDEVFTFIEDKNKASVQAKKLRRMVVNNRQDFTQILVTTVKEITRSR